MKRKVILLSTILVVVLLSVVGYLSYGYFTANININSNANINTTLPNGSYKFEVVNTGTINFSFNSTQMMQSASSTDAVASGNTNIEVKLTAPDNVSRVSCTYDLVWHWKSTDKYTQSDAVLPINDNGTIYNYEYSVKASSITTGSPSGVDYYSFNTLEETDLSAYSWNETKTTILAGATIVSQNSNVPTVTKWDLSSLFYNIPVNQVNLYNKNFSSEVKVENINCDIPDIKPVIISGDINTLGSEVKIGTEYFYVLTDSGNSTKKVKLLAKYNLLVGSFDGVSNHVFTPSDVGYNMQSEAADSLARWSIHVGVTPYSASGYWNNNLGKYGATSYSEHPYVYDENSYLYQYVENYKYIINNKFGINASARLINYDEANSIYNTTWGHSRPYWTGAAYGDSMMWYISNDCDSVFCHYYYYSSNSRGVRPVIIVSKSIFN